MSALTGPAQWRRISQALSYYQSKWTFLEVPWVVSPAAVAITKPPEARALTSSEGTLVGSAEQSFLDLHLRGSLPLGEVLVTVSPCFRPGDDHAETCHLPAFLKVELGFFCQAARDPGPEIKKPVAVLAELFREEAQRCIRELFPSLREENFSLDIPPSPTERQLPLGLGSLWENQLGDLLLGGVEVGSYGVRLWTPPTGDQALLWAFGSGLAEPRTSWAVGRLSHMGDLPTA